MFKCIEDAIEQLVLELTDQFLNMSKIEKNKRE